MGRLRSIDIVGITAIKSDDLLRDEVFYLSFLRCGDAAESGAAPDSQVPRSNVGMRRPRFPLKCKEGADVVPPARWGTLFPSGGEHQRCCADASRAVSGSVYLFDSDDPHIGFKILGAVLITLASALGVLVAALAFPPLSFLKLAAATVVGVAVWALLAGVWQRFIHMIARADYLGGVRISFPCQSNRPIEETHDLRGAREGIASVGGRTTWGASSAEYRVTFRATYG